LCMCVEDINIWQEIRPSWIFVRLQICWCQNGSENMLNWFGLITVILYINVHYKTWLAKARSSILTVGLCVFYLDFSDFSAFWHLSRTVFYSCLLAADFHAICCEDPNENMYLLIASIFEMSARHGPWRECFGG